VSLPSSYRSRRGHIHLLRVLPLVGCRSKTPTAQDLPVAHGFAGLEGRQLGFPLVRWVDNSVFLRFSGLAAGFCRNLHGFARCTKKTTRNNPCFNILYIGRDLSYSRSTRSTCGYKQAIGFNVPINGHFGLEKDFGYIP
jgi:hypothetical protein